MTQDVEAGNKTNVHWAIRSGLFLKSETQLHINVTTDFLIGLHDSFVSPEEAMYQVGMGWGGAFGTRLEKQAARFQASLSNLAIEEILLIIQDHWITSGWGRINFDLERYAAFGIILASVEAGPVSLIGPPLADSISSLIAGFLAGTFAVVSDLPMESVAHRMQEEQVWFVEIMIGHEKHIKAIRSAMARGVPWEETPGNSVVRGRE